jgi:hypothetical protein
MVRFRGPTVVACFVLALLTLGGLVPAGAASPLATSHRSATPSHKLVQQGPITFWECPAKSTRALISVSSLTLHPGDHLQLNFIVRNVGTKACNYVSPVGGVPGAASGTLTMGPCGAVGFEILGAHNRNVWPGVKPFNCPALTFAQLPVNGVAVGSGTWDQSNQTATGRVPPGRYVLMVDDHYTFALQIKKG